MNITAILQINGGELEGKVKIPERIPKIRIPVTVPLTIDWLHEAFTPDSPNRHKILIFEWYKQVKRYTHIYRLKEIE